MDLLFKRYASPFLFMGEYLRSGRFHEFVFEFVKTINEEHENDVNWSFYLHKVQEGSYQDFIDEIEINKQNRNMTESDTEEIVKESFNILNNFTPDERGD